MIPCPVKESDLSSEVQSRLRGERLFRVIPVETAIDDGWCDLLLLNRESGLPIALELKIGEIKSDEFILKTLQSVQVNFLYGFLETPGSKAGILFSVKSQLYVIPAYRSADWIRLLNRRKISRTDPLVQPISWSGIGAALAAALPCAPPLPAATATS